MLTLILLESEAETGCSPYDCSPSTNNNCSPDYSSCNPDYSHCSTDN